MIKDIVRSIVDFSFYKEVPRRDVWATTAYIVVLGAFFSAAVTAAVYRNVGPRIREAVAWAAVAMPPMTVANGKLSSTVPGPTEVRHPDMKQVGLMIDIGRTAPVSAAEMSQKKLIAYLTADQAYIMTNDRLEAYDLAKTKPKGETVVIDAAFYENMGATLLKVLYPIAFFVSWMTFIVWKHGSAAVYTLVAMLINAVAEGGHEVPVLYRLAVYAQTPVILLQALALFLPRPIPLFPVLAVVVVSAYLWQAIRFAEPEGPPPA
ncbi:MAG: DUF1189 family protein [Elusimicrobia bacterium]|nr:DUF1189 family protein [Elusimicrobiota bacterium]